MVICAAIAIIVSILFVKDSNLFYSLIFATIYGVINGINTLLLQIYQITSNFKKYSIFSISMRLLGLLAVSILLLLKIYDFKYFIIADIASLVIVTAILVYYNYELFKPRNHLLFSWNDYKQSINSGLPLLIANMMGILTIGVGRFIIQFGGGISDFAQYSFGMSIASLVSVAVASVSVVLYPMIKKTDKQVLSNLYNRIANFLKISIIFVILLYYLSIIFIRLYYPKYSGLIEYLNILYAIIYLQTITSVLQNTYYKVLRQERRLFIENLISIIVLILVGIPTYAFFKNVISVAFVTLIAVIIRFFLSEKYLQKTLKLNNINFHPEFLLLLCFILLTYFYSTSVTFYFIIPCTIFYIYMKKDIIASVLKKK